MPSEIGAYLALTLQLIRLSIDLIRVASQKALPPKSNATTISELTTSEVPSERDALLYRNHSESSHSREKEKVSSVYILATSWMLLLAGSLLWTFYSHSNVFLILTSLIAAMELLLIARDPKRERQPSILLPVLTFGTLWISACLQNHHDRLALSLIVTAMLLLVLLDACLNRQPEQEQEKPKLSRKAMMALLKPYFWPDVNTNDATAVQNRIRAVLTWVCVISSKVTGLYSPLLLGWASTALSHQDYTQTIRYSCLYAFISLLSAVFKEGQSLIYLKVAQAGFVQLSEAAFAHVHGLSLDWHLQKKLGEVLRSMDRGISACDSLMRWLFLWLIPALAECIVVCIIFATYFNYRPLALTVFYFVFTYIVWTILLTLWRKKFRKEMTQSDNDWHDVFTDSLVNFETVKYFTAEKFERQRFQTAVSRYQAGSVNVQSSLAFLNISQRVLLQACLACSLSLAAWGVKQRADCCVETMGCDSGLSDCCRYVSQASCPGMSVGDFVAVLTYTLNLFAPLNFLGSVYNSIVMSIIDLTNLSELLAENPDVVDAEDALLLPKRNSREPDVAIEFDNVHFRYPTQPQEGGLKGVSFKMKRGTTTAIVGSTGAGKTTISRLLFRFYDVLSGAVKVNGMDVRSVTQQSLRGAIGVVPQSANMFNNTIRANLLYGKQDATQEELEQATRDAQLLGFIESLDEGWETVVGDQGLKLSGGERQRMAIARCLLKNPPFVLLDEATSALDTLTEASVQEALDRLGKERTVLVIAHRLGTIRNADNIIVLKDGRVAEEGTHDELLRKKGTYAEMWNRQLHTGSSYNSHDDLTDLIAEASFASPSRYLE